MRPLDVDAMFGQPYKYVHVFLGGTGGSPGNPIYFSAGEYITKVEARQDTVLVYLRLYTNKVCIHGQIDR